MSSAPMSTPTKSRSRILLRCFASMTGCRVLGCSAANNLTT
jgi:hypothetical protein